MSELFQDSPGWSLSEAEANAEQVLEGSTAFRVVEVVDSRPEAKRFGTCVVGVMRETGESLPSGFGAWPDQYRASLVDTSSTPWVERPNIEVPLVLKMGRLDTDLATERGALLAANQLFTDDAPCRPPRLYGYGVSDIEPGSYLAPGTYGYLLMEYISSDFIEYPELKNQTETMSFQEVFGFLSSYTEFLSYIHEQGITHGDLGDFGQDEHIFYNRQTQQMRIIDWSESRLITEEDPRSIDGGILLDQDGIAMMMRELIEPRIATDAVLLEKFKQIHDRIATEHGYSFTPEGTKQILADLLAFGKLVEE